MPPIIMATALAAFDGDASLRATIAPTPKYAPWGRPDMNLAAQNVQKPGATAASRLPTIMTAASSSMSFFKAIFLANSRAGAPTHTPPA